MIELICQAANDIHVDVPQFQGWLQIATSTGFVGLAWYLIAFALPRMQERFDQHSDRQLAAFKEEVEKTREFADRQLARVLEKYGS